MMFFSELSKTIIYTILSAATIIVIIGLFFLENATDFSQIHIARKVVETGFALVPVSILSAVIIEYIRKKTVS